MNNTDKPWSLRPGPANRPGMSYVRTPNGIPLGYIKPLARTDLWKADAAPYWPDNGVWMTTTHPEDSYSDVLSSEDAAAQAVYNWHANNHDTHSDQGCACNYQLDPWNPFPEEET
jgi:hypothetical protein